jgi:hypothetical protein
MIKTNVCAGAFVFLLKSKDGKNKVVIFREFYYF